MASNPTPTDQRVLAHLGEDVTTADKIAAAENLSVRTVYRSVARLREEGLHIMGEPGVGYMLRQGAA